MEVVFQRVLREGRGRRELGRVPQQGRRAPARRALGELVRVCRVLGSRGSQCVWSSRWAGAKGGMVVADRALGLVAAFLLPRVLGPDVRTDAGLDCLCQPCAAPAPRSLGCRPTGPRQTVAILCSGPLWKEHRAVKEVILCRGLGALSRWWGG